MHEVVVFHASKHKFDKFDNNYIIELGFHFSKNENICLRAVSPISKTKASIKNPIYIYKCKLAITHSLRCKDAMEWSNISNIGELNFFDDIPGYNYNNNNPGSGLLYYGKEISLSKNPKAVDKALEDCRQNFLNHNINCIRYKNEYEGKDLSYMMFDANDIFIENRYRK